MRPRLCLPTDRLWAEEQLALRSRLATHHHSLPFATHAPPATNKSVSSPAAPQPAAVVHGDADQRAAEEPSRGHPAQRSQAGAPPGAAAGQLCQRQVCGTLITGMPQQLMGVLLNSCRSQAFNVVQPWAAQLSAWPWWLTLPALPLPVPAGRAEEVVLGHTGQWQVHKPRMVSIQASLTDWHGGIILR